MPIIFLTNEDDKKYIKSINGATPDENGNVEVKVAGSNSTSISQEVLYYSSLSSAITDINTSVTDNAVADASNAKVKVFTAHTGAIAIMLLDDVSESEEITINKDIDLALNGKTLTLTTVAAVLTFAEGTSCKIYGSVNGSAIIKEVSGASAHAFVLTANGDLRIEGGRYSLNGSNSGQNIVIKATGTCGILDISGATLESTNSTFKSKAVQSQSANTVIRDGSILSATSHTAADGILCVTNLVIRDSSVSARSQGIASEQTTAVFTQSEAFIETSEITAVTNTGVAFALLNKVGVARVRDSVIRGDAPGCQTDDVAFAYAVYNNGAVYLEDVTAFGTHSAISTHGSVYINGGTYTGYCHGGVYVGSGGADVFINDATLRCSNYDGEFDYSGNVNSVYGSMYIGGSETANNLTSYLDGCTFETAGVYSIVLRGSSGEQNNTVNISNSTIAGSIRIDNDTLKLNVGAGTNITTGMITSPERAVFTDELYRRQHSDRPLTGADCVAMIRSVSADQDSGQDDYELPVGGDELGGVKNGGNVTINADGTMTAPVVDVTQEDVQEAVDKHLTDNPVECSCVLDATEIITHSQFWFTGKDSAAYGAIGQVAPCKNGEKLFWNGNLATQGGYQTPRMLSALPDPASIYDSSITIGAEVPVNEDGSYTATSDGAIFFPAVFTNGVNSESYISNGYVYLGSGNWFVFKGGKIDPYYANNFPVNHVFNVNPSTLDLAGILKNYIPMVGAKVAVLGDSLSEQSAGHGNAGRDSYGFAQGRYNEEGWFARIARKYNMDYRVHGVGMQWWYCTSDRPNGGVRAVNSLIESGYNPDYIVLEYGTNDIWTGTLGESTDTADAAATSTAGALRYCIETLQAQLPSAKIIVIMPCMRGVNDTKQDSYYEMVTKILREYGVRHVDMLGDSGIVRSMMNADGVHLATFEINKYNQHTEAVARYSRCLEAEMLKA